MYALCVGKASQKNPKWNIMRKSTRERSRFSVGLVGKVFSTAVLLHHTDSHIPFFFKLQEKFCADF